MLDVADMEPEVEHEGVASVFPRLNLEGPHLGSVLQEGEENSNIHIGFGSQPGDPGLSLHDLQDTIRN